MANKKTSNRIVSLGIYASIGSFLLLTDFKARTVCAQGQQEGNQSVTLAWNANTEPDLAGYNIYYGLESRKYLWHIDVGNVTTMTIPNLRDATTYFFAATAYNTSGLVSDYSNEVIYKTFSERPLPPRLIRSFTQ